MAYKQVYPPIGIHRVYVVRLKRHDGVVKTIELDTMVNVAAWLEQFDRIDWCFISEQFNVTEGEKQ